jgi:uncharacterized protein YndB with AHSA1/START domain
MLAKGTAEVTVTLPSETEIRFTRIFNRPRQLLFEAWTRPEHIRHWWGCDGASISVCEIDLRVGGSWKIVMRMLHGGDHPFHGVYREIALGERLVYSECYDVPQIGSPEWLTTVTFEEIEGGTRLTHTIRHRSRQARDGHLQSGMEAGAIQSLHRLDEQVARMLESGVQS